MTTRRSDDRGAPAVAGSIAAVRQAVEEARRAGRTIALVPTMGALHAGHTSLIEAASTTGAFTVVSIYVNPTQFGPNEDLDSYPRTPDADRAACGTAGGDLIFAPTSAEMYPRGEQTRVVPGRLAETMCGKFRPGHFQGVCTVVAKLFNIVRPDVAYFGQKDAQQVLIIRRMVQDLHVPVRIETCPIVREPDGLAVSSRNVHLDQEERTRALCLYRALCAGRDALLSGEASIDRVVGLMQRTVSETASASGGPVTIDYLTAVDAESLEALRSPRGRILLAGAVHVGRTRLIDNLVVDLPGDRG
jgi:pantoate--beta-alanine ligase